MWIDISIPLRNGCVNWPGDERFQLTRVADMNRDGTEYNISKISTSVHMGTHMDAPLHFVNGGATIDTMPLDATLGPCRVIEIQHPTQITVAELEPHEIQQGERILFKTRTSFEQWKTDEFLKDYVYIPVATAKYLVARGVRTIGVDALSVGGWDDENAECHRTILGAGIWIIEWLDLSQVEPGDYELACLPLKLVGSEGAPARAAIRKRT
jgi:arylformamidase